MLAALATGTGADPWSWNPVVGTVEPDPANVEVYAGYYQRYRQLYPATLDIAHFLADQQQESTPD